MLCLYIQEGISVILLYIYELLFMYLLCYLFIHEPTSCVALTRIVFK